MTIKQQGGIFGRNPTFKDVTIEGNLTSSGTYVPASIDVTNDATVGDQLAVGTTEQNGQLHIYSGDSGASRNSNCNVFIENDGAAGISIGTPSANAGFLMFADEGGTGRGFIQYDHTTDYLNLAASGSTRVSIQGNNIALNNGGGIDFSATSGTGTSELFDDYEEGTWTPTGCGASPVGVYTKMGDTVFAYCEVKANSVSTNTIGGLPFTVGSGNSAIGGYFGRARFADIFDANGNEVRIRMLGTDIKFMSNGGLSGDANATITTAAGGIVQLAISVIYKV